MLSALVILALIGIAFFGSYALRALLPSGHVLQSFVTDEAIEARTNFTVKHYRHIFGLALITYLTAVTVIYS